MARKRNQYNPVDSFDPFMFWSQFLPVSPGGETQGRGLENPGADLLAKIVAVNEECANVMKKRLERDVDHAQALPRCASLIEAGELQRKWLQGAVNDYASETFTLMNLGNGLMSPSAARGSDETDAPTKSMRR